MLRKLGQTERSIIQREFQGWNEVMSIARTHVFLAFSVAVCVLSSDAAAQREIHHVPPAVTFDGYNPDLTHPFIEPLTFDHDWQFFHQADPEIFGNPEANIGFFATYNRMYLWMTRPDDQSAVSQSGQPYTAGDGTNGDFTWGNRFDIGYMTGEDHGWFMTFFNLDGPSVFDITQTERNNVFQPLDQINGDPNNQINLRGGGAGGGGGQQQQGPNPRIPGFPVRDRNNPFTLQRDYLTSNSINDAELTSWELNKTFRMHRLHYGSLMEPFVGFRYGKFLDRFQRDRYRRFDANGILVPIGANDTVQATAQSEEFLRDQSQFMNYLVGGQLGFRTLHEKGRWDLSSEFRLFAFQNFQSFTRQTDLESTFYGAGPAVGVVPVTVRLDRDKTAGNATEFVFGTEIRAEAAYRVTRDVGLNLGMNFLYFGKGIGRGGDLQQNDQDVVLIGGVMGFVVNR